jgi:Kae1-associated kinase Bud32
MAVSEPSSARELMARGAEANLYLGELWGRQVVHKHRVPKKYRLPELDARLRVSRTKREAKLLVEARRAGVRTPTIYDIDLGEGRITMQHIDGPPVKETLAGMERSAREELAREIGRQIAMLHAAGIVHGDLTTSNMILSHGSIQGLHFIDFSLGSMTDEIESMGVDLHLLKEVWQSSHFEHMHDFYILLESYATDHPRGDEVLAKVGEIEKRGRYT